MGEDHAVQPSGNSPTGDKSLLDRIIKVLSSLKFALPVLVIIALACVAGTLLPQGGDVQKYLSANPDAVNRMTFLSALGLTRVYSAWWFIGLLSLFAASLTVCTARRFAGLKNKTGRARGRAIGSVLTHVSLVLILAGGVMRVALGETGYLELREGETKSGFTSGGKFKKLPFAVHLAKFEIEFYDESPEKDTPGKKHWDERLLVRWKEKDLTATLSPELDIEHIVAPEGGPVGSENSVAVTVRRRVPDFFIDLDTDTVNSRSDQPRNPAILVDVVHDGHTNSQWLFAKYPGFDMSHSVTGVVQEVPLDMIYETRADTTSERRVKDYKSSLEILDGDTVVKKKTIEVNLPLSYAGYTFYQSGYDPKDDAWTSLQVVRDPGVPVVYTGFALMIAGLAMIFYIYPGPKGR